MDILISLYYKTPVTDEIRKQLDTKLPHFVAAWNNDGPLLFEEIYQVFKRGFQATTRTAVINLSHYFSYGSHWFLILGLRGFCEPQE